MKIHAWLYTGKNKGRLVSLGEWQSFQLALLKAAGYVPHCPCGCSPSKPFPEEHEDFVPQKVWEETPAEPLVVSHNLEYAFRGHAKIGFIHCKAIADRMTELLPLATVIAPDDCAIGLTVIASLRWHALHMEDVCFEGEGVELVA